MKGKIFTVFLFIILMSNQSMSQSKIYLDENMKMIDSIQFRNKCKNRIFKCLDYTKDTLTINKVLKKYSFGKIHKDEVNQIKLIFEKSTNKKISTSNSLIIVYRDTLMGYHDIKERIDKSTNRITTEANSNPIIRLGILKPIEPKYRDLDYFKKKKNKWYRLQKKCKEKIENTYSSNVYHVYNFNKNEDSLNRELNWIKDTGVFKNKFFSVIYNYHTLIIKPNGEYFLKGGYLSDKKIYTLLNNDDWSQYIIDLNKSVNSNSINGFGFFESVQINTNKKHCF